MTSSSCSMHGNGAGKRADEKKALADNLRHIRHKILVLSGKGGVGKSTVAVNLASALSRSGLKVGLLDVDIHGPTVPVMLGLEGNLLSSHEERLEPVLAGGLKVMSIAFAFGAGDRPVIWRGPLKMSVIEQFLRDTLWGELDVLVIDAPPGTGDEPLSVAQLVPDAKAVVVTTPQRVATADVRKSIVFCRQLGMSVVGVVQNMAGVICPECNTTIPLFPEGSVEQMTEELGVELLCSLPLDPRVAAHADQGQVVFDVRESPLKKLLSDLARNVMARVASEPESDDDVAATCIAVPLAEGRLGAHFGHCDSFAFLNLDPSTGTILSREDRVPPPHEPGVIPRWVASQKANLVLAGGMGSKAIELFRAAGVEVLTGCPAATPEELVTWYANDTLSRGSNVCGHDGGHGCGHH